MGVSERQKLCWACPGAEPQATGRVGEAEGRLWPPRQEPHQDAAVRSGSRSRSRLRPADRALMEDPALAGVSRLARRELGRDHRGDRPHCSPEPPSYRRQLDWPDETLMGCMESSETSVRKLDHL
jgi:hypothetical protein